MPVFESQNVLSGISVGETMRRQVISLSDSAQIGQCIRMMIRYKTNAILLLTDNGIPSGVVSKTDLMGAFYAELPTSTPSGEVTGSQPIACFPDDPVETALEIMEAAGVHRLYITGADREQVLGTVSYSDIVGLIYRYCRSCDRGTTQKRKKHSRSDSSTFFRVQEVMTKDVIACRETDLLYTVIEILSEHRMGALLVFNEVHSSIGVISKTDLIVAFHHGLPPTAKAQKIMNTPVYSVPAEGFLSEAIQQMLIRDVQRIFVHQNASNPDKIAGVLALSDAARFRSGSCRACTAGRIIIQ